jgi:hypothetical protein
VSDDELGSTTPITSIALWMLVTAPVCMAAAVVLVPLLLLAPPLAIPLLLAMLVLGGAVGTLPLWSRLGHRG